MFQKISNETFLKYWPLIQTNLPRINNNSRIMTTFKKSRYQKFVKLMIQKFDNREINKIFFKRNKNNEEEEGFV